MPLAGLISQLSGGDGLKDALQRVAESDKSLGQGEGGKGMMDSIREGEDEEDAQKVLDKEEKLGGDFTQVKAWKSLLYQEIITEAAEKLSLLNIVANNTLSANVIRHKTSYRSNASHDDLIAADIDKIKKTRSELTKVLRETARFIRNDASYDPLVLYIERFQQSQYDDELLSKEKNYAKNKKVLEKLQAEAALEKRDLEMDLKSVEEELQRLQDTEVELKQLVSQRQKYVQKEHIANEAAYKFHLSSELKESQDEYQTLSKIKVHEMAAHNQVMEFLDWQRLQIEKDIEQLMAKFERDLEDKGKELENLKQKKEDTLEKYDDLQSEYENVARMVDDEIADRQRKKEALIQMRRSIWAAKRIQRFYREYRARKAAKKGKKKGKK